MFSQILFILISDSFGAGLFIYMILSGTFPYLTVKISTYVDENTLALKFW